MIFKDSRYTNVEINMDDGVDTFSARRLPKFSRTGCKVHTVIQGESLDLIANKYYGNSRYWWAILDANIEEVGDFFNVVPGTKLYIPNLSEIREVLNNG